MNFNLNISSLLRVLGQIFRGDILLPMVILCVYVIVLVIARGYIPTGEELVNTFAELYSRYGYQIIFFAALLEGLVLINLFVPGSLGLALGAVFARTGQTDLTLVVLTASAGVVISYLIDYGLGYFGFSRLVNKAGYGNLLKQSKNQLQRFGKRSLIVGFIHSNLGAFLSLSAGILKYNFLTFLIVAIVSTVAWASLWGILIYSVGEVFIEIVKKYSFLIFFLSVTMLIIFRLWKGEDEKLH